jgi:glycosyltransferase involved in cell wall biosynthesis
LVLLNGMLDPWSLRQSRWKKRAALAVAHRRLLNGAARLHLGNADEERLIRPLRLTAPRVIVPNGVTPPADWPPAGAFRATRPELGGDPFVLFLSRLHPKKGLDLLAEAFAAVAGRVPGVRLVVAGPDDGSRADFEARVAWLRVADRVHLVGPLYGADKWAALRDAACFCLPSRQEGFSVAILEALACGRPAVVTENCHFPEVGTAGAGVVTRLDARAVADGLIAVLSDPAAADRMGAAGRGLVAERYTWGRVAAQLEGVYRDVLGG